MIIKNISKLINFLTKQIDAVYWFNLVLVSNCHNYSEKNMTMNVSVVITFLDFN